MSGSRFLGGFLFCVGLFISQLGLANNDKALIEAVKAQNYAEIERLVSEGVKPKAYKKNKGSAVSAAVCNDDTRALDLLKSAGWDMNDEKATETNQALLHAALLKKPNAIAWLIDNGAVTSWVWSKDEWTILELVMEHDVAEELCAKPGDKTAAMEVIAKSNFDVALVGKRKVKGILCQGKRAPGAFTKCALTARWKSSLVRKEGDFYWYLLTLGDYPELMDIVHRHRKPITDANTYFLLSTALNFGRVDSVRWMLDNGVVANQQDSVIGYDRSEKRYMDNNFITADTAVYLGSPKGRVPPSSDRQRSILTEAAIGPASIEQRALAAFLLVKAGADIELKDRDGITANEFLRQYAPAVHSQLKNMMASYRTQQRKEKVARNAAILPPDILFDKYMVGLSSALNKENYAEALGYFDQLNALGMPLPDEMTFYQGKSLVKTGNTQAGIDTLYDYIAKVGKSGEHYLEALRLAAQAEMQ